MLQLDPRDDALVAAVGTSLMGLDLGDGAVRWRTELADQVDPDCVECLSVVDRRVVALTVDGTLTAIDQVDGAEVWQRRLDSVEGQVHTIGERLVVTDQASDPGAPTRIDVIDGLSGTVLHQISPRCPGPDDGITIDLALGDPFVAVPGSTDFVAVLGRSDTCVRRWSTDTGALVWSVERSGLGALSAPELTVDDGTLLVADVSSLWTVGLSEGSVTPVPLPPGTTLGPAVLRGTIAVVGLGPTQQTPHWAVVGIDTATGERLWTSRTDAGDELVTGLGVGNGVVRSSGSRFTLLPRADSEVSLVSVAVGRASTVASLDATDGARTPVGSGELAQDSSGADVATVDTVSVDPLRITLVVDGILQAIDVPTGSITAF